MTAVIDGVPVVSPEPSDAQGSGEDQGRAARRRAAGRPASSPSTPTTPSGRAGRRTTDRRTRQLRLVAMALAILATLCIGLVLTLSVLGALKAQRDQRTAYDDFRYNLANGTAPVGQTDENGVLLEPGTSVALLDIPAIGVSQVVAEGTTSSILMSGPGHRRDTVLPGQSGVSVVFGRRAAFGGPFQGIDRLKPGDEIKTLTGQAEATYRVVDVRRAGDPLPAPAKNGRLVLLTADGRPWVPTGVVAVDADLVTEAQPANPRVVTAASLAPAELPLQGDSSAWVSLLLWAQALLLVSVGVVVAWARWGRWEAWLVGIPVVLAVAVATFVQVAALMPNLL